MSSPSARRHPAVLIYNGPILPTKVAAVLDLVRCLAKLPTGNTQRIAHVAGRVARTVPNDPAHRQPALARGLPHARGGTSTPRPRRGTRGLAAATLFRSAADP